MVSLINGAGPIGHRKNKFPTNVNISVKGKAIFKKSGGNQRRIVLWLKESKKESIGKFDGLDFLKIKNYCLFKNAIRKF
jgi:hypothetical protein